VAAILYKIGQHNRKLAEEFANEWVTGAKVGRNAAFDVLANRLQRVMTTGGGHVNPTVRAAMIIQTFNHWNAGEVPAPGSIRWKLGLTFPKLEFDVSAFRAKKRRSEEDDTSLRAVHLRILNAMAARASEGRVQMSHKEIEVDANVHKGTVAYHIEQLKDQGLVKQVSVGRSGNPSIYELKLDKAQGAAA
jgi:hypothetical protein